MSKKKIISISIDTGKYTEILESITTLAKAKRPAYVCFANVHMTVESIGNSNLNNAVNKATMVTSDGMPIAKAMSLKYGIKQDRAAGMDIMPDMFRVASEQDLSVFLYGSTDEVLNNVRKKAESIHPGLKISGTFSPPFGEFNTNANREHVELINSCNPDIVMVALGCPKQEIWMNKHTDQINATLLGLGGAFPVYAEMVTRAPIWMQQLALEWLYRLGQEPVRLFRRYFITNNIFLLRIVVDILSYKIRK